MEIILSHIWYIIAIFLIGAMTGLLSYKFISKIFVNKDNQLEQEKSNHD